MPKQITFDITHIDLFLTDGTDEIILVLNCPSSFPVMKYDTLVHISTQYNFGEKWLKENFNLEPDNIKNIRKSEYE